MEADLLLTTTAVLAAGFLVGRLAIAALRIPWLARLTPEAAAASTVAGVAISTLAATWLSRAGLPSPRVAIALGAFTVALAAATRGRGFVWRPRGTPVAWLALLGPAVLTGFVALLPALRTGGYAAGNDTFTYCAFSEWLQRSSFAEPCAWDADSPVTYFPSLWQELHYDLGIAHLLALVQAASHAPVCLVVYPAVSAAGVALLLAAVFLVARWGLRLSAPASGLVGLVFALLPHPVYWGHHNGFLQQTYALPAVLFGVALAVRYLGRRRLTSREAFLPALLAAFLIAEYLPFLLVLGAAWAGFAVVSFLRARRRRTVATWLFFMAWSAGFSLLLAAKDLPGLVTRVSMFAEATSGGPVLRGGWSFAEFAAGTRVPGVGREDVALPIVTAPNRWAVPVYLLLAVAGAIAIVRRPRTWPLAGPAAAIGLGLAYYALLVRDPWSQQTGHSWNTFKLIQWAYPFLLLLQAAGLRMLSRPARVGSRWLVPALAFLPLSLVAIHGPWSAGLGLSMREMIAADRPLEALPSVRAHLQQLPPGTLFVVGRPANHNDWLALTLALLAYPRPIRGDWAQSSNLHVHPDQASAYTLGLENLGAPDLVPLLAGSSAFEPEGLVDLGGGIRHLLATDRPRILYAVNPAGPPLASSIEPVAVVSSGRTKLVLFSPRAGRLELRFEVPAGSRGTMEAYFSPGDFDRGTVLAALDRGPVARLRLGDDASVVLPLEVPQGIGTVVLVGAVERPIAFRRISVR